MASRLLVDTNVISLIIKRKLGRLNKPEIKDVASWYESKLSGQTVFLSFATKAELIRWVLLGQNQTDRERRGKAVESFVESCHVIQSDDDMLESWAMISNLAKKRGRFSKPNPLSSQINDIWIAASAHANRLALLTADAGFDWLAELDVEVLRYPETTLPPQ